MGAPKAEDRDHACGMAQSGFESVENTNNTNKTIGNAEQVGGVVICFALLALSIRLYGS